MSPLADCLTAEVDWLTGVPKESIFGKAHNMELYFEEDDFDGFIAKLGSAMTFST